MSNRVWRSSNVPPRFLRVRNLLNEVASQPDPADYRRVDPGPEDNGGGNEEGGHYGRPRRGRKRKNRNRGNRNHGNDEQHGENPQPSGSGVAPRGNDKSRCPPHLRGAAIGLWYKEQRIRKKIIEVFVKEEVYKLMENHLRETNDLTRNCGRIILNKWLEWQTFEEKIQEYEYKPMMRDNRWDVQMYCQERRKVVHRPYQYMMSYKKSLPTYRMRSDILEIIETNQVSIISGGTGCGKSTQIPQYVLDLYIRNEIGSLCNIVCTQPRRISAISLAERVAAERVEQVGLSVGYQIRLENKIAWRKTGCINFVTTGILLQWLIGNPVLENISHVFLDEVHERTVESDALMTLLKYIIRKRPDLKVILMSATVNTSSFANYFNGAPELTIPGITYPVEELFLEDILKITDFKFKKPNKVLLSESFLEHVLPYVRNLEADGSYPISVTKELANPLSEELNISLIAQVVRHICLNEEDGGILVFLPGLTDLAKLSEEIYDSRWFNRSTYIVVIVHSLLTSVEQKEAFMIPPRGKRKIIIATSILETSVTVDDISFVVDCGKRKSPGYDVSHNVNTLMESWISLANAKQRRGRAGRTKPGKCYKLYTRIRQQIFDEYPVPEIQTSNLEQVILETKALKLQRVIPFLQNMIDPPEMNVIQLALKTLRNLNALDNEERLTPLGFYLSKLPTDPRTGKMILLAALFSCIDPVFSVAACLSFRDPFSIPLGQEHELLKIKDKFSKGEMSDHFIFRQVLYEYERIAHSERVNFSHANYLSLHNLNLLSEMKKQYAEILCGMGFLSSCDVKHPDSNMNSDNLQLFKAIVCAGLYPNVAILRSPKTLRTMNNEIVRFHKKSFCSCATGFESIFFVYHYTLKSTSVYIHDATMISVLPLLLFGQNFRIVSEDNRYVVKIDDFLKVKMNLKLARLIQKIRNNLDMVLTSAISSAQGFDWNKNYGKVRILKGIVDLITADKFQHDTCLL